MPERMCREAAARGQAQSGFFDDLLNASRVYSPAFGTHEQRDMAVFLRLQDALGIAGSQVSGESAGRMFAERNDPLLSPFTEHSYETLWQVQAIVIEAHQFTKPKPAGVKQLEDGPIAQVPQGSALRRFYDGSGFGFRQI